MTEYRHTATYVTSLRCRTDKDHLKRDHKKLSVLSIGTTTGAAHEVKHSIPTWQKSIDLLGFEHKTNLYDGLSDMWKWAQQQPMRKRFIWENYELDKGIYSFWKEVPIIL